MNLSLPFPPQRSTSTAPPPIPDRVLCLPFHRPYGAMAADGVKTIETRARAWTKGPAWIAIYNCVAIAHLQEGAAPHPGAARYHECREVEVIGPSEHVIGLVHIASSRILTLEDMPRSFFYEPGRFAWILDHAIRFAKPLSLIDAGMKKGPQSVVWIEGEPLREAARKGP